MAAEEEEVRDARWAARQQLVEQIRRGAEAERIPAVRDRDRRAIEIQEQTNWHEFQAQATSCAILRWNLHMRDASARGSCVSSLSLVMNQEGLTIISTPQFERPA